MGNPRRRCAELCWAGAGDRTEPIGPRPRQAAGVTDRQSRVSVSVIVSAYFAIGATTCLALFNTVAPPSRSLGVLLFIFALVGVCPRLHRLVLGDSYRRAYRAPVHFCRRLSVGFISAPGINIHPSCQIKVGSKLGDLAPVSLCGCRARVSSSYLAGSLGLD